MNRKPQAYRRGFGAGFTRSPHLADLLLVIGGVILLALSVAYIVAALYISAVLAEIQHKDFSQANIRLRKYEAFFENLKKQGFDVDESRPYIKDGAKNFLWAVTVPGIGRRLIYRWRHDLESNKVEPLTSSATYLDIQLGYISPEDAKNYPYEPGDEIARRLAAGTYNLKLALSESQAGEEKPVEVAQSATEQEKGEEGKALEQQEEAKDKGEAKEETPPDDAEGESVAVKGEGGAEESKTEQKDEGKNKDEVGKHSEGKAEEEAGNENESSKDEGSAQEDKKDSGDSEKEQANDSQEEQ